MIKYIDRWMSKWANWENLEPDKVHVCDTQLKRGIYLHYDRDCFRCCFKELETTSKKSWVAEDKANSKEKKACQFIFL